MMSKNRNFNWDEIIQRQTSPEKKCQYRLVQSVLTPSDFTALEEREPQVTENILRKIIKQTGLKGCICYYIFSDLLNNLGYENSIDRRTFLGGKEIPLEEGISFGRVLLYSEAVEEYSKALDMEDGTEKKNVIESLAQSGNISAQLHLAKLWKNSRNPEHLKKREFYLKNAAAFGDESACLELADDCMELGDFEKASMYYANVMGDTLTKKQLESMQYLYLLKIKSNHIVKLSLISGMISFFVIGLILWGAFSVVGKTLFCISEAISLIHMLILCCQQKKHPQSNPLLLLSMQGIFFSIGMLFLLIR